MSIIYVLGTPPFIYVPALNGLPNAMGFFRTLDTVTGAPKPVYLDQAGTFPARNPVPLTAAGITETPIYFKIDSDGNLYTLDILDEFGNLLYSIPNYPDVQSGGGNVVVNNNVVNYARNEQFAFWNRGTVFTNDLLPVGTTEIADDWYFSRSNTTADVTIQEYIFNAGVNLAPFSPAKALRVTVSSASPDSEGYISQFYESVQTLNNQTATWSFYAATLNSGGSAPLNILLIQNFGTGGSSPVTTTLATETINDTIVQYTVTAVFPTIGGETIGTAGDDNIQMIIQIDTNVVQDIIITDVAFQSGTGSGTAYPYISENEQYVKILPDVLRGYSDTQGTNIIGWSSTQNLHQYLISLSQASNTEEFLIGWYFSSNPYQFGGTMASVNNNTYIADQTVLLSDGNGVVGKDGIVGENLVLTVLQTGKKFGILNIIEYVNARAINFQLMSLGARLEVSGGTTTFKMAIIQWSGTPNAPTRNAVSAWNAAGTNPSLASGWSYASSVFSFDLDSSSIIELQSLNAQLMSTANNYGVLIWNDSADMTVTDTVRFYDASLSIGTVARNNQYSDIGTSLRLCQRYYSTSYNLGVDIGSITNQSSPSTCPPSAHAGVNSGNIFPITIGTSGTIVVNTSSFNWWANFPVPMLVAPSVTIFNPRLSFGTGHGYLYISATVAATGGSNDVPVAVQGETEGGFNMLFDAGMLTFPTPSTINTSPIIYFNYTADARLGV